MADTTKSKKHDWGMFFSGLLLVVFAFVIMLWPGATLVTLAIMAGVLLLFSGGANISQYIRLRKTAEHTGWMLVNAILDIILGVMFVIHPIASAQVLPWLAGIFVIVYGVMAIVTSIGIRSVGASWLVMLLYGLLSIVIGIMFIINPAYFVLFLGIFLAMRGVVMCVYGIIAPRALPYM